MRKTLLICLSGLVFVAGAQPLGHGQFQLSPAAEKGINEPPGPRSYVLFESAPVRPLALTHDGRRLLVTNTPDGRLEILARTEVGLIPEFSVPVGMEPVAVAVTADDSQAWVVNHLSDSVSIVDLSSDPPTVVRTLWVGDEPRDIVFAGPGRSRAFITTAHRGQNSPVNPALTTPGIGRADVWVFDGAGKQPEGGSPLAILSLFGDTPRALAVNADASRVYAAVFRSGNRTTTLPPPVPPFIKAEPTTSADGVAQPNTGLIVKRHTLGWLDELGQNHNDRVGFELPDLDVFEIDAMASVPVELRAFPNVGTTLFNLAVNPRSGAIYVSNTDARNHVRFAGAAERATTSVQGRLADNRITVIGADGVARARRLNTHLDFTTRTGTEEQRGLSLSQPMGMAVSADGELLYLTAFGSATLARYRTAELEQGPVQPNAADQLKLAGGGPAGVVIAPGEDRLYVYTRFDNGVSTVDIVGFTETAHLRLFSPEPEHIVAGRPFLYDARATSTFGNDSCATCHLFGDNDALAWDLGDPDGTVQPIPNAYHPQTATGGLNFTFHPMKGPMSTQSMRGLRNHGPMHWRGDRTGVGRAAGESLEEAAFKEFNEAFFALMGREELDDGQMQDFTDFAMELSYPPNPLRRLDDSLNASQEIGRALYNQGVIRGDNGTLEICVQCHPVIPQQGVFGTRGLMAFNNQPGETDFKIPHFRDQYQKIGSFAPAISNPFISGPQIRGFGFNHNGATHTSNILDDLRLPTAQFNGLRDYLFAFPTGMAPIVGQQVTLDAAATADVQERLDLLIEQDEAEQPLPACDLVVHAVVDGDPRGWLRQADGSFLSDDDGEQPWSEANLRALAAEPGQAVTFACVPWGSGGRVALDRDLDGVGNHRELIQGSWPDDPSSSTFNPLAGLWYNPRRPGHGIDLQRSGEQLVLTWYTYQDDGQPVWYQASGPLQQDFSAELRRFEWSVEQGGVSGAVVGQLSFSFADRETAQFDWTLDGRTGSEPFQRFVFDPALTARPYTGIWFDASEPGWGLSIDTLGSTRVAVAYFYDAHNQPRWAIGTAENTPGGEAAMLSATGFCPDCEFAEALFSDGGRVQLTFADARNAAVTLSLPYPGAAGGTWQRNTLIQPLSSPPNLPR